MKAIIMTRYGSADGLSLADIPRPAINDDQVLIKTHAATVTAGDCEFRALKFPFWITVPLRLYFGILKPRRPVVLGQELSGEVVAVGKNVTRFKVGDPIFGATGFHFGAYAEYAALPAESDDGVLAIKPENITFDEAACIPTGGLEAVHFLKRANIQRGQKVLINGAGGSIGTFGIQLAKYYGAEVTAVDSAEKFDVLREAGADHVIDYAREDFTKNGKTYDVIFDVIGKSPFGRSIKALKSGGTYLIANPKIAKAIRGLWVTLLTDKTVYVSPSTHAQEDLDFLKSLAETGAIRSLIDRRYPLEQTVEAHRYVEAGHKKGNLIITIAL